MTLDGAMLAAFDKGLSIVPIPFGQKRPTIPWKRFQETRPSRQQVIEWSKHPQNYSIATGAVSQVVVVDLDSQEAEAWADIYLDETPWRVRTHRGAHLYYRHPGVRVRNIIGLETSFGRMDVDIKGDGGLALGPHSKHPSGVIYQPMGDWSVAVEDLPVFDVGIIPKPRPVVVRRAVAHTGGVIERARRYVDVVPGAVEGEGGDRSTYVLACKLVRDFGLDEQAAASLLLERWNQKCRPPWSERELFDKCRNASRYGTGTIGGAV